MLRHVENLGKGDGIISCDVMFAKASFYFSEDYQELKATKSKVIFSKLHKIGSFYFAS